MFRGISLFSLLLIFCYSLFAQTNGSAHFQKDYQLHVSRAKSTIKIDGELTDSAWQYASQANDFWGKYPNDFAKAKRKTEVKLLFDNDYLYFGFTMCDSGDVIIQSLKRDIGHDNNDGIAIVLDPLNKKTNGFWFVLNAFNAQSDDQLHIGSDVTLSWDNKWYSETKRYKNKWTAEIAIPFKTLRYSTDKKLWGINFVRIDQKTYEYSTWTHVPVNFKSYDLGYTGALIWDEPPPPPGKNIVLIPYATGGVSSDKENNIPTKGTLNAGFDAKLGITPSLNLDMTLNPDFSQVEVDQQVTNLTRYNIFFPEKRSFFLENNDLFGSYGINGFINPFYSRTIGLDKNGNKIPIIAGARLSGNISKSTRIGVMDMQTGNKGDYYADNYAALSINQSVLKRSTIKGYLLNRQSMEPDSLKQSDPLSKWGRNAGLEFDYSNLSGTWNAWGAFHQSIKSGLHNANQFVDLGFTYKTRHLSITQDLGSTGTNYYTDMGYVQRINNYDAVRDTTIRVGFKHLFNELGYNFFPTKGPAARIEFLLDNFIVFNPDNSFNEREHTLNFNLGFKNTSNMKAIVIADEVHLLYPISFTNGKPLPAAPYSYAQFTISFGSDTRKLFSYNISTGGGGFYNGSLKTISGAINLRSQPHLNIAIQAEYDKISLPDPYGSTELFLISPKVEINFSTKIFWTTFLQYNTQQNNYNINSRFQYRYKPMSDLFLVYTDNYFTTPQLTNKNRAIVFKMNYWLNL
ncbi:MAG: carbohydrate binding family 9 domain-containing protein [Bacteroidetes bacterium]|nr:carbohydrate binding family 9 domain-containing protein [Bacteroidota bacterium]